MSRFKACALISAIDGSDNKDIHCFKGANPCHAGLEMLAQQTDLTNGQEENPFHVDPHRNNTRGTTRSSNR